MALRIAPILALLLALALLMFGNGILGGALALRATDAGQSEIIVGFLWRLILPVSLRAHLVLRI